MREPTAKSRQIAFTILAKNGDVLKDDESLNDLIDDVAAAIDNAYEDGMRQTANQAAMPLDLTAKPIMGLL